MTDIDPDTLSAAVELIASRGPDIEAARQQGFEAGRQSALHDPEFAYNVGFDTGLSARQDTRAGVHRLIAGFEEGTAARKAIVRDLIEHEQRNHMARTEPELDELELS